MTQSMPKQPTMRGMLETKIYESIALLKLTPSDISGVIAHVVNGHVPAGSTPKKLATLTDDQISKVRQALKETVKKAEYLKKNPAYKDALEDPIDRELLTKAVERVKPIRVVTPSATKKPVKPGKLVKPVLVKTGGKEFPICRCGCGQHTKGGVYRQGHDAIHHSKLRELGRPIPLLKDRKKNKKRGK